uniref:Pepsin-I3 domain-containing protein n=1 Tax=Loa loa TaxID=7209 RepID=A0A1I7VZH5_LOALO
MYHAIINSFNGNIICVNNVCYNSNGILVAGNTGCFVINGKIYKDGKYLRNMTWDDYQKLKTYYDEVNRWSVDLQDSIQRSFPWDERNPSHTEFPWNIISGALNRNTKIKNSNRKKRFMPFPVAPYFC